MLTKCSLCRQLTSECYHNTYVALCVGGSLGKEVDISVCVSELPPVVVVPGGVGTRAHSTTQHYMC